MVDRLSPLRIQTGPRLSGMLKQKSGGGRSVQVAGRGAASLNASGGGSLLNIPQQWMVRAIVAAVHAPSGSSAPALPSEVTYDIIAVGRPDIDLLGAMVPEWRSVQDDEVPIWPRAVGTRCLLIEWPDPDTQRRWSLFMPEAVAWFECGGGA